MDKSSSLPLVVDGEGNRYRNIDDVFKEDSNGDIYIDRKAVRRMAVKLVEPLEGVSVRDGLNLLNEACVTLDAIRSGEVSLAELEDRQWKWPPSAS